MAMRLRLYRTLWGAVADVNGPPRGRSVDAMFAETAALGYAGVEGSVKFVLDYGVDAFQVLLAKHKLTFIAMVFTDGPNVPQGHAGYARPTATSSVEAHLAHLERQVADVLPLRPWLINVHGGRDYFSRSEVSAYFNGVMRLEAKLGVRLCHETHRGRILYSPWVMADILAEFPKLALVADLSHFTCVAEAFFDCPELQDVVELLAPRVVHIHARVGFEEGPQVSDPRAPEWMKHTRGFEQWWELIWRRQRAAGVTETSCTPEHGAPYYQHCMPYTKQPLADVWDVNSWIGDRLRARFAAVQDETRSLTWAGGRVDVQRLGAMSVPSFVLDGRVVQPMHVAPWAHEPGMADEAGILRSLRGEWPCVPFGYTVPASAVAEAWHHGPAAADEETHGHASNHEWEWMDTCNGTHLALRIVYPPTSPVERLERTITPVPGAAAVDMELRIYVRRACVMPLGLHPCFRLPSEVGGATIESTAPGHTYPGTLELGATLFAEFKPFASLKAVPSRHDGAAAVDASRLPFAEPVEELLQLHGADSIALANHVDGYRVRLHWNRDHFPSLLLWMSNRGRTAYPWSGRHCCLGMEPICSPFGLGESLAVRANPISDAGVPTCRSFAEGEVFVTRYRIAVESIDKP